jgi:hypothetical protein
MTRALDVFTPRVVEYELWTSAIAEAAQWDNQFRLKDVSTTAVSPTTAVGFSRAVSLAEQAAADTKIIDNYGGAYIHMSPALFSLVLSFYQGLIRSPTGRTVMTPWGANLIPEVGATGEWSESAGHSRAAKPGGSATGDNIATGWLFVTPPVRVRLGAVQIYQSNFALTNVTNDSTFVAERAVCIEAFQTAVAIPVDYTKEF